MSNSPEEKLVVKCDSCNKDIDGETYTIDGYRENYCYDCYHETMRECYECGRIMHENDAYTHDDNSFCYRHVPDEEDENGGVPEREYSTENLPQFQSSTCGEIISSKRIFSAEIECYYEDNSELQRVARNLDRAYGVSEDGSLGSRGVEFQTPKLKGRNGENAIKEICQQLNSNSFYVDKSTGLHIHLDAKGLLPKTRTLHAPYELRSLWAFHIAFEDVMLSFLPRSRRANRFCKVLKTEFNVKEILKCSNLREIEQLWYRTRKAKDLKYHKSHKYDDTRYAGVNLHSLLANKHLEIRYHSGTLDSTKILQWVALHQKIMDLASNNDLHYSSEVWATASLEDKTDMFFQALQLPTSTEQYFRGRQATFNSIRAPKEEESAVVMA